MTSKERAIRALVLDFMQRADYKPMREIALAELCGYADSEENLRDFCRVLTLMQRDYDIVPNAKGKLIPAFRAGLFKGEIQANRRGFAMLRHNDKHLPDIFIGKSNLKGAMHKDKVLVHVFGDWRNFDPNCGYHPEGEVTKILERGSSRFVGVLRFSGREALVYPDEQRLELVLAVPYGDIMDAADGDKVLAEVKSWGGRRHQPLGRVVKVLGPADAPGIDMESILWQFDLPQDFPPEVKNAAEKAAKFVIDEKTIEDRWDFREQPMVTIDGADAKDLDDAVACEILENGNFGLSVHIADVGHYVPAKSVLDNEAFRRGTSVYLPGTVVPMLPKELSNGVCSLNAGEDRLALSCIMEIDREGNILDHEICESVIHVGKRFTYDAVQRLITDGPAEDDEAEWLPMLKILAELQEILAEKRRRRGAVNFDIAEAKIVLDENGKVQYIQRRVQRQAEKMIEEAMIAANETVAEHFNKAKVPFVYRVHEGPGGDKLLNLNQAIAPFGLYLPEDERGVKPRAMQELLEQAADTPANDLVQRLALRSMSHALYAPACGGHFGLASRYYCHFTSPIRRYADLVIHRIIKEVLHKKPTAERRQELINWTDRAAEQASRTERAAEEAEREAVRLKCCQFMAEHLGDVFPGKVSGVISGGIFVELENTVEGRVGIADLPDDYYTYIPERQELAGRRHTFRLGDEVFVQVAAVSVEARTIDFVLSAASS